MCSWARPDAPIEWVRQKIGDRRAVCNAEMLVAPDRKRIEDYRGAVYLA